MCHRATSATRPFIVDLVAQVNSTRGRSFSTRTRDPTAAGIAGTFKPALAVMARAPGPGKVKTRLCPPLDPRQAAEFYECVLRDMLRDLTPLERWDTWVAYAERSRDYFLQVANAGVSLLPQRGASLGVRMHAVFTDLCHAGYRQVVLVGSDIPNLKSASIRRACDVLERDLADVVLGPADDGGYYLIGLKRPEERLFTDIAWSTASVLEHTLAKARQLELRVRTVAGAYDVDVAEDLARLSRDLARSRALRARRPRTHAWMRRRIFT